MYTVHVQRYVIVVNPMPFLLPVIGLCSVCALRGEANLSLAEGSPTTRRGKWTWGASELLRHGGYGRHFLGSVYKIIYLHIYTYVYIYIHIYIWLVVWNMRILWLSYFSEGLKPPTRYIHICIIYIYKIWSGWDMMGRDHLEDHSTTRKWLATIVCGMILQGQKHLVFIDFLCGCVWKWAYRPGIN